MAEFLQYTVNGLIAGSTYGLLALAMTLIYGILAIPDFSLGAIYRPGGVYFLLYHSVAGTGVLSVQPVSGYPLGRAYRDLQRKDCILAA